MNKTDARILVDNWVDKIAVLWHREGISTLAAATRLTLEASESELDELSEAFKLLDDDLQNVLIDHEELARQLTKEADATIGDTVDDPEAGKEKYIPPGFLHGPGNGAETPRTSYFDVQVELNDSEVGDASVQGPLR